VAKRRTRKQKEKVKYKFTTTSASEAKKQVSSLTVKGQFQTKAKATKTNRVKKEIADRSAKLGNLASIRKDMVKSIILAGFIVGLEIVIYLAWHK
jgi:hypothetical protein